MKLVLTKDMQNKSTIAYVHVLSHTQVQITAYTAALSRVCTFHRVHVPLLLALDCSNTHNIHISYQTIYLGYSTNSKTKISCNAQG